MKTSDQLVAACMELMHESFVKLRTAAAALRETAENGSSQKSNYIAQLARSSRAVMKCLKQDVSDQEVEAAITCIEPMSGSSRHEPIPASWLRKIRSRDNYPRALVDDEMKKKIFVLIDDRLEKVERYCELTSKTTSYNLYWEMNMVHNVPLEIYRDKKGYGNIINK